MSSGDTVDDICASIEQQVLASASGTKRMKVKSLLKKYGIERRTEANTYMITEALGTLGLHLNPSIMKLGNTWEMNLEDWVYLSKQAAHPIVENSPSQTPQPPSDWNADGWFDRICSLRLRSEKEVDAKFIVHLLLKLGYSEDDRYDGMTFQASVGSKAKLLEIDFALFNTEMESLNNQLLLVVESKKEDRCAKQVELRKAINQAKCYAIWTGSHYWMVTDSKILEVYHASRIGKLVCIPDNQVPHSVEPPIFSCAREELKDRFATLYGLVSKEALTKYYLELVGTIEEIQ